MSSPQLSPTCPWYFTKTFSRPVHALAILEVPQKMPHTHLVPRAAHDGWEDSAWGVIASKASLAQPGAIVTDQSSCLLFTHDGARRWWESEHLEEEKQKNIRNPGCSKYSGTRLNPACPTAEAPGQSCRAGHNLDPAQRCTETQPPLL